MIVFALFFLVGIGIFYNNAVSAGFANTAIVNSCSSLNCPSYGNQNPCTLNPQNCYANKTISIVNPNSPFTYLVSGDLLGFIGSFTGGSGTGVGQASVHTVALYCKTVSGSGISITAFTCDRSSSTADANYPYPIYNATSSGNSSIWYVVGFQGKNNVEVLPLQNAPFTFYGGYFANNTVINSVTAGQSFTCHLTGTENYCLVPLPQPSSVNLGNVFTFMAFINGIVLLIVGLGLSLSAQVVATGFSFGSNAQGTRLAEAGGMALLIFAPSYSEFGTWLTDTDLGFTGGGILLTFIIFGLIFFGIYEQTTSGTAGS